MRRTSISHWIRRRLTYANVMATLAVMLSMTGTAWAVATIGSAQVIDKSLRGVDVRDDTLGARVLAPNSVGASEIGSGAVDEDDLSAALQARLDALEAGDIVALEGLACTRGPLTGTVVADVDAPSGAVTLTCDVTEQCPAPLPDYPHAAESCDSPMGPVEATCDALWADANESLDPDGCELSLNTMDNCGSIGNSLTPPQFCVGGQTASPEVCNGIDDDRDLAIDNSPTGAPSYPNMVANCVGGGWQFTCELGWLDTNAILEDGCEDPE